MVTSPSSSPPPKWNSKRAGGGDSGHLLQELESLSQALYQSQKKPPSSQSYAAQPASPQLQSQRSQPKPPAKKHSFLSRKEGQHSGRRLSHDPPTDQTSSSMEPLPFSSLSPHDPPPSFTSQLLSRHSLSSAHAPSPSFEQQKSAASGLRGRFSLSGISSRKASPAWGADKSEVRSRNDRRLSLPPSQSKNQEKSISEEQQDWPDDASDSSCRFDSTSSDKKKSVWSSWKPLRALSHIGRQRLHCVFSAYVHAIEGLPPAMNGLRLCVHMRKEETKEGAVQTMPSRVFQGIAEFQETLFMKCTLYGNKGPSNSMKFMEKAFIVSVIAPDIEELDFGRHQLDLSRLLGDFLEERKGQLEKGSSWDTMLDLTGKAKGGRLAITFNYEILDKDSSVSGNISSRFRESPPHRSSMHTSYSLPNSAHGTPRSIKARAHLNHSPTVSEPGNDYDDLLAMDQLNLDEPPPAPRDPPLSEAQEMRGGQTSEVQGFPVFRSQLDRPPLPPQGALNAFPSDDSKLKIDQISTTPLPLQSSLKEFDLGTSGAVESGDELPSGAVESGDELPSEEEDEFVVVDKGMEIGESMENFLGNIIVEKELDEAEEEAPDGPIPHVVEIDAMDELPQVVGVDDLSPQVVDMEAFDDLPPRMVEVQAFSTPMVDEKESLEGHSLRETVSQVPEKDEFCDLQGLEDEKQRSLKEQFDLKGQQPTGLVAVASSGDDKEVQEDVEKIVTVDEGERKDNVTYVMVMQTLDSLLQGTSSKELQQEEEKVEVESSADGIFSDEEDTAEKEMISNTSPSKLDNDPRELATELNADFFEDAGSDSEEFENKGQGSNDIKEISVNDAAEEDEVGSNAPEEEQRHSKFTEEEEKGVKEERGMNIWEGEDKSFSASEDEVSRSGKQSEDEDKGVSKEEIGMNVLETGDRSFNASEDEASCNSKQSEDEEKGVGKEEIGMNVLERGDRSFSASEDEGLGNSNQPEEEKKGVGKDVWEGEKSFSASEDEGFGKDVWEGDKSFSALEDEGLGTDKQCEEVKRSIHVVEEEELSTGLDTKEEVERIDIVKHKGLDGFEAEGSGYRYEDSELNHSDATVLKSVTEEESASISSNAEVSLLKEIADKKFDDAVFEDVDIEVDLVAGQFLDMLGMGNTSMNTGYDSEVDSPRARLLKEFEEEALFDGSFGLDFNVPEFLLDGALTDEDTAPNALVAQSSARKMEEKAPSSWGYTSTQINEGDLVDHAFASTFVEEEVAEGDHTLPSKGSSNYSANWDHTSSPKGKELAGWDWMETIDEEPEDQNSVTAYKEMDKELSYEGHTLASKGMEKSALLDQTLGFKRVDEDSEKVLAMEDPGHQRSRVSALKVADEDHSSWTHTTLALKGMDQNEPVNLGIDQRSNDSNQLFSLKQTVKEPSSWGSASALKPKQEEPAVSVEILAFKERHVEPDKLDHSIEPAKLDYNISLNGSGKEPTHRDLYLPSQQIKAEFSPSTASKELGKWPLNGASELPTNMISEEPENWDLEADNELMFFMEAAESELQRATQSMRSKSRAKMLEDAETEALMQEWGLDEKVFVSSPPKSTIRQQELPSLGKGLGATIPLKDGGSLRSLNPSLFQANKSKGKLVMQISKPVVVPAEMGTETSDILRNMASMGIENMAVQAMTAMPLEDITGRSVEQVAIDGMTASKSGHRLLEGPAGSRKDPMGRLDRNSRTSSQNIADDFVSLEDIAPMAMQQIEALAIDGLKIQADVAEDDTPFGFNSFTVDGEPGPRDMSAGSAILKGVTGVHLSKGATSSTETSGDSSRKGLMGMAISLDEWMLLDAGLYDEAETKKDALAIMAAHHAAHQDIVVAGDDEKRKKRQGSKNTGGRWGCMGNTLTIAMLVQLRDPLKNNEAVGAPMMAFVQAERMMKPPKMKVGRNVPMKGGSEDEEAEPEFKITGVHMSGLKASQEEKKIGWGNQKQLQSGSRWLIANGMTKNAKMNRPMLGNKPAAVSSLSSPSKANANKGESLWSISSRALSSGLRWRDKLKLNVPAKNP